MIKGYLEVDYILIVGGRHFTLMDVIYDLEYESLQHGLECVFTDLVIMIEETALSDGSTINELLKKYDLFDYCKLKGDDWYTYTLLNPFKVVNELAVSDDIEDSPF